jgi:phosphocarrier protein HPr
MITKSFVIKNTEGLHARPSGILVKTAQGFKSQIEVTTANGKKNAKSVINLMSLGLKQNEILELTFIGEDETQASEKISQLIESEFQA